MERVEELINVVSIKTGLSKEEIKLKIKNKENELSGLVSEEGAAYIVANELGVKTRNRIIEKNLKINEVLPEMKSVTLLGRVKNIIGPREFTTKKGVKSKVVNLDIVDNTGSVRIVLWNMSDVEKIEKEEIKIGSIIQVRNGYTRTGLNGNTEVHLGNRGILIDNPDTDEEFPEVGALMKISEITPDRDVNVAGRVTYNFGINEFDKDGRKGKVGNVVLNDGTSSIRLVLWNEKADLLNELEIGDILKVENAYSKEGLRGMEIQGNWATRITKNPKDVDLPSIKELGKSGISRVNISDLKAGDTYKEIRGVVVDIFGDKFVYDMCPTCNKGIKEGVCEKCGTVTPNKLLIVNAMLDDSTSTIKGVFFRDVAEKLIGMKTSEAEDPVKVLEKTDEIIGREIIAEGRVKQNEVTNSLEFNVYNLQDVNPVKEAEGIVKDMEKIGEVF